MTNAKSVDNAAGNMEKVDDACGKNEGMILLDKVPSIKGAANPPMR